MGPHETEQPGMVFYGDGSGDKPLQSITDIPDVTEIVIDTDNIPYDETHTVGSLQPIGISGHFIPRRMSRKRFVKLLMANGYSQNEVNAAIRCARTPSCYSMVYMFLTLWGLVKN